MDEIKTVVICGLGAVGSMYATKIFDFDKSMVKIVADEKRIDKYKKSPLKFNDKVYEFEYILPKDGFEADLVLIATKSSGLNDAIKSIKSFVGEKTVIMSLMNGITSEKELAKEFGSKNILYSYYVGHSSERTGREIHFD